MKHRLLLIIIIIIELSIVFNCTSRIITILHSQSRIFEFKIQRDILAKQLAEKQELFDFVRTDTYIEKIAREKLGFAREGDVVYIVAHDKQHSVDLPQIALDSSPRSGGQFGEVGNWWRVFFD